MPESISPEANYLSRDNIVLPSHIPAAEVAAMEARARTAIGERTGVTVTSGTIRKAKI